MQYNKYHDQFLELEAARTVLAKNLDELAVTQGWYVKFDSSASATNIGNIKRSITKCMAEISELEQKILIQASEVSKIREKVSLGWNPKYWFSAERGTFKFDLGNKIAELSQLKIRLESLQKQAKTQSGIVGARKNAFDLALVVERQ